MVSECTTKSINQLNEYNMVSMGVMLWVLDNYGEYCGHCWFGEPSLNFNNTTQTIDCEICGESIKLETLVDEARNLPFDYPERMIQFPASKTGIESIGDDVWIAGSSLAEKAGDVRYCYPDRQLFQPIDSISKLLNNIGSDVYEKAQLSNTLYRMGSDTLVAVLKSSNFTVYINNDFVKHFGGVFIPYITSDPLKPILIRSGGELLRIIMPLRFNPEK